MEKQLSVLSQLGTLGAALGAVLGIGSALIYLYNKVNPLSKFNVLDESLKRIEEKQNKLDEQLIDIANNSKGCYRILSGMEKSFGDMEKSFEKINHLYDLLEVNGREKSGKYKWIISDDVLIQINDIYQSMQLLKQHFRMLNSESK